MSNSNPVPSPGRPRSRTVSATAVAILVAAAALSLGSGVPLGAQAPDGPAAARHGAAWLAQQVAGGLPLENFGSGDWGATVDAGLALAGSGSGGSAAAAVWDAVVASREEVVAPGGSDSPGRLAKVVLLARALGEDPRAVGPGPGADLVERLAALVQTDGPDAGLFGAADATYDGAYRQGLALVALSAVGAAVDPASVSWLESQQCDDGSWMPYRSDLAEPCAFDPGLFVGPDSNSTALALAGLTAAAPGSAALPAARNWLDDNQNDDGGWGFYPGDPSDPNSTATVIQALIGDGSLADERFGDRPGSPLAALLSFQLGCSAPADERGAFTFPGTGDAPSLLATTQAVPAAAGAAFDHVAGDLAPGVEPLDCEPATTTTSGIDPEPSPVASSAPAPLPASGPGVGAGAGTAGAPAPASSLALTGGSNGALALVGAALVALGALAVVRSRRLD